MKPGEIRFAVQLEDGSLKLNGNGAPFHRYEDAEHIASGKSWRYRDLKNAKVVPVTLTVLATMPAIVRNATAG